jgi:hypothetical protein
MGLLDGVDGWPTPPAHPPAALTPALRHRAMQRSTRNSAAPGAANLASRARCPLSRIESHRLFRSCALRSLARTARHRHLHLPHQPARAVGQSRKVDQWPGSRPRLLNLHRRPPRAATPRAAHSRASADPLLDAPPASPSLPATPESGFPADWCSLQDQRQAPAPGRVSSRSGCVG